jgi:integrase
MSYLTQLDRESQIKSNFIDSLRSAKTKDVYDKALKLFMKFHNFETYSVLLGSQDIEEKIKQYMMNIRSRELSTSFMTIFLSAIKTFYEMNDIENIRWRKLKRFMGEETPRHEDRKYTHQEILTLLNASDLKQKVIILLMSSAGLRIGALPTLLVKHLTKMNDVYKVDVYKGLKGKGQYYTFCTPEATKAIDNYLEFRERCGEKLVPTSPLLRKDFDSDFHESARNKVYPVTLNSISMSVFNLLIKTGILTVDHINSRNRKDVKMTHGMRKFFETMLVNSNIHETIIRKLTGHSDRSNLTQLYSKQNEDEMLEQFMLAIDNLTINPENRMRRERDVLKQKYDKLDAVLDRVMKLEKELGLV